MLRLSSAIAAAAAIVSAVLLYAVSYDTRHWISIVQSQERQIERLRSDIAVLKAELAYLARPERIEPAARSLGFVPAAGDQYVDLHSVEPVGSTQRSDVESAAPSQRSSQ
ncbi:MAG: cell division protein FtsL [Proteobacteria bacterium]|jgi:cell division protein FtsL|nr:MAG: cell division protein FtsL [Pseudomonadota bacterium]